MKTFTIQIDEKMESTIEWLQDEMGEKTKAKVFKLSIALLKIALESRSDGFCLAIINKDKDNSWYKEIVIP